MRPAAWTGLGVTAFVVAALLFAGAFTRFTDEPEPPQGDPAFASFQERKYDEARLSVILGLTACFAMLGGAACMQQARRGRTSP